LRKKGGVSTKIAKTRILVLIILGLILFSTGCSEEIFSANQINPLNENEIHVMQVTTANTNTKYIADEALPTAIIKHLDNIKFTKVSKNEEKKVLDKGNKFNLESTFVVELMKEKRGEALSNIILTSENELILADSKTMQSSERTVLYINENDETSLNAVKEIYTLVQSTLEVTKPYVIPKENVREIKAMIPKLDGKTDLVISGSDFYNLLDSYNTANVVKDGGGYVGNTITIEIYLNDGSWLSLIEDSPKTVRVAYHKNDQETQKKIEAPWITGYIHDLRVTYKAVW
jgi:PBP1b-binding outer membrane lipoprotein LpoB